MTTQLDNSATPLDDTLSAVQRAPPVPLIYSCRRCRTALFRDNMLSFHEVGVHHFSYRRAHKNAGGGGVGGAVLSSSGSGSGSGGSGEAGEQQQQPPPTCTSHFLSEALVWMASASSDLEGKLNCPGCSSRVGTLSWVGSQCSCGTWVNPSIQILKKYVEAVGHEVKLVVGGGAGPAPPPGDGEGGGIQPPPTNTTAVS